MFLVIRVAGDYDSFYTCPTVYYPTIEQAQEAAREATAFIKRAGFQGRDADKLPFEVRYGDEEGTDTAWNHHVEKHGGLPAADPNLKPESFDQYGLHPYQVKKIEQGEVPA